MKSSIIISMLVLCAACASGPKTIPLENRAALERPDTTLISVQEDPAGFIPTVPERAAFAALGAVASISAGARMLEEHQIENPAELIEGQLIDYLNETYGHRVSDEMVDYRDQRKPKDFLERDQHLAVDATTTGWGYSYFSLNWNRYRVFYSAQIQLVDANSAELLAAHACSQISHDSPDGAPTKSELVEDNAALLKEILGNLANRCVSEFRTEALGEGGTPDELVNTADNLLP